jgi:hypothetical protein
MSYSKNYVTFYSPGSFVCEETEKEIEEWNIVKAIAMASSVGERYGAVPFGFRFSTLTASVDGFKPPKTTNKSGMYYLGGKLLTKDDVGREWGDSILYRNMVNNDIELIIQNDNSWRWTAEFKKKDVLLPEDLLVDFRAALKQRNTTKKRN